MGTNSPTTHFPDTKEATCPTPSPSPTTAPARRSPSRSPTACSRPRRSGSSTPTCSCTTRRTCRRRRASRRSPTSTATPASCATAATRSSSSPSTRPTSRSPTCCSTASCPNKAELDQWTFDVTHHTFIHENMRKRFVDGFHYDAHPMGMFVSAVAALGTFYNDSKEIFDPESRDKQILRLIAKTPTLAAMCYRFSVGPAVQLPDNALSFPANFLNMMWKIGEYERATRCSSGRWTCCSSSTPTTSRTAAPPRCASSARATPIPTRRRRPRRARLRPAARRRQRGGRADAHRDRLDRQRAGVHRGGQGAARAG